jgi:hypothetical protein
MTIDELEAWFRNKELPVSVKLGPGVNIDNVKSFVDSHIQVLRNMGQKQAYQAFYDRLIALKNILEK